MQINKNLINFFKKFKFNVKTYLSIKFVLANNQKEKIFSNKVVQNFLENEPSVTVKNKYKIAEIASSLAYYLKSFSNINKLPVSYTHLTLPTK